MQRSRRAISVLLFLQRTTTAFFLSRAAVSGTPSRENHSISFSMIKSKNQEWDTELYQKHSFVFEYGSSLVDILNPQPLESILDVGCGSGQLTKKIADRGSLVQGFDSDPNMIQKARAEFPDIIFFLDDVTKLDMTDKVDAIFSNAALHWVMDAEGAVSAMSRTLKPDGRFVVEFGGRGNVNRIVKASNAILGHQDNRNPWFFPSISEYATLLESHHIETVSATLLDRPTILEDGSEGMSNWLRMFGGILLEGAGEDRELVIEKIVDQLRNEPESLFNGEHWTADYRRIRIIGRKHR